MNQKAEKGMGLAKRWSGIATPTLLIVLCFLSRLPQLMSGNLLLDGDESIVGLMAKHVAEGKEFPLFFYGQSYGFSAIENCFGAFFFKLFGMNTMALKLAMLSLWSIGIVFYYKTFFLISNNKKTALLLTLLLIFIPPWAVWSMKARGGYLSAFTLSAMAIYWLIKLKYKRSIIISFIIGFVIGIITLSQPLWIPGLIPIIVYSFWDKKRIREVLLLIAGIVICIALIKVLIPHKDSDYWSPTIFSIPHLMQTITALPELLFNHFAGMIDPGESTETGTFSGILSLVWIGFICLGMGIQLYRMYSKKQHPIASVFMLSSLLTMSYIFILKEGFSSRYLLPLSGYLVLWIGVEFTSVAMNTKIFKMLMNGVLIVVILLGVCSVLEFRDYSTLPEMPNKQHTEQQNIDELTTYLETNNIHYAYSLDPYLQWQIMFYSKEKITSRYLFEDERCPLLPPLVDAALRDGKPTAIIGYIYALEGLETMVNKDSLIHEVSTRYFVYKNPTEAQLKSLKFEF